MSPLDKIPDVNIDGDGKFKYILVHVHDDVNKQTKYIVRGYARCQWHGEYLSKVFDSVFMNYHYRLLKFVMLISINKNVPDASSDKLC